MAAARGWPLSVISRCVGSFEYGSEKCRACLSSDGHISGARCGEPCGWIMQKAGHGDPPFRWKRKLFAGDVELPDQEWSAG